MLGFSFPIRLFHGQTELLELVPTCSSLALVYPSQYGIQVETIHGRLYMARGARLYGQSMRTGHVGKAGADLHCACGIRARGDATNLMHR